MNGSNGRPDPPVDESLLLSAARPNVLLEGSVAEVNAVVDALRPHLSRPVATWCGGVGCALPENHAGTLIVQNVDRLDAPQQRALIGWLNDSAGAVQVITVATEPLFPLVVSGVLLERLYYLLNIVRVEVSSEASARMFG